MPTIEEFGAWVAKKGGQKGLAATYKKKLGRTVSQAAISGWFTNRRIPEARRPDLETLGWHGPWEWPREEAQDAQAGGPAPYVTREEFAELVGRLKRLEEDFRALFPLAVAVKDLDARVQKVEGGRESRG